MARKKITVENAIGKYISVPKIASPEARRNFTVENATGKYFSVPKIASPEARKKINKKML